jgi:hypothetical protein
LEIIPAQIDLGAVLVREERTFVTKVKNNSDELLEISRVRPSCGCTKVRLRKSNLSPGECTELAGTLRGKARAGPFRHQVILMTSAPRPERAVCFISGQAQRRIRLVPERLTLSPDFLSDSPDSRELVVQNTSQQGVDVTCSGEFAAGVRVELDGESIAPGESRTVTLTVAPDVLVRADVNLTLRCSHPLEKALPVRVEIRPTPEVKVSPVAVRLGVVSRRELVSMRPIEVDLDGDLLTASELVEVTLPSYLRESGNTEGGLAKRRFVFAFQDAFSRTDLSDRIIIKFRHAESGRLFRVKVAVSGFLRDYRES